MRARVSQVQISGSGGVRASQEPGILISVCQLETSVTFPSPELPIPRECSSGSCSGDGTN